jgi:molybdopterin synthase sulfur carrier subunit
VIVRLPGLLESYTSGMREVPAEGSTVGEVLAFLDLRYPGIRFRVIDEQDRIRRHMRIFAGDVLVRSLDHAVGESGVVQIIGALSGG